MSLYDLIYYLDSLSLDTLKFRVVPVLNAESAAAVQVLYVAQAAEEKVGMFPFEGLGAFESVSATPRTVVVYHMGVQSAQVHCVVELVF